MDKKTALTKAAIGSLLAAGTLTLALQARTQSNDELEVEKCYGVVKAGKNDCAGPGHTCSGKATIDAHPAEYILLPAGTCERLVNGSLTKGQ